MKKKYNYLLALAVFLVIMICFNKFGYIISYLAAIGGPLVMGNNGTMVVYEFLMSHLNLVSAILYIWFCLFLLYGIILLFSCVKEESVQSQANAEESDWTDAF